MTLVLIVTQGEHIPHLKPSEFRNADQRISWLLGFSPPKVASQNEVGTEF
jgi:hypothetical protein